MKETQGTQSVEVIAGRNIIVSAGTGKTNIDDLKWLMSTVLSKVGSWKTSGWAYVADCTQMEPVGPGEIGQLVEMTKSFVDAGCKAFGFAEGSSLMLKVKQRKIHKCLTQALLKDILKQLNKFLNG